MSAERLILSRRSQIARALPRARIIEGGGPRAYIVGGMFTAAYSKKAERLAASCERFRLPYVLHEVPTIHRSISARGSDDLSYTKPNFILHLLSKYQKPVLYLDCDVEVVRYPELLDELISARTDFAVYNGYADAESTDKFLPFESSVSAEAALIGNRFYRFRGCNR